MGSHEGPYWVFFYFFIYKNYLYRNLIDAKSHFNTYNNANKTKMMCLLNVIQYVQTCKHLGFSANPSLKSVGSVTMWDSLYHAASQFVPGLASV